MYDTEVQGSEVTILLLSVQDSPPFLSENPIKTAEGLRVLALTSYGIVRGFHRYMWPKLEYYNVIRLKFLC